jgi:hypothetical protein
LRIAKRYYRQFAGNEVVRRENKGSGNAGCSRVYEIPDAKDLSRHHFYRAEQAVAV